jgi:hypothetical protein
LTGAQLTELGRLLDDGPEWRIATLFLGMDNAE